MKRATLQNIVDWMLRTLTNLEYSGLENIPPEGGVLITTNHMSRLDIPILFVNPVRKDITALVADKYKGHFFFGWFTQVSEGIWIDRSRADFTAFRDAITVMKNGRAVGISPEGTRSDISQLLEGKAGTIILALKSDVPIVPVGISGTDTAVRKIFSFQRPTIHLRYGPAYRLPPLGRENREETMKQYTDEIMLRIAALLPPRYHGAYANHPRLKEFQELSGPVTE
jgi:1-acyl-sn-glycerol-3-phosphate acyltransferase